MTIRENYKLSASYFLEHFGSVGSGSGSGFNDSMGKRGYPKRWRLYSTGLPAARESSVCRKPQPGNISDQLRTAASERRSPRL
jgi:hypothetical protein